MISHREIPAIIFLIIWLPINVYAGDHGSHPENMSHYESDTYYDRLANRFVDFLNNWYQKEKGRTWAELSRLTEAQGCYVSAVTLQRTAERKTKPKPRTWEAVYKSVEGCPPPPGVEAQENTGVTFMRSGQTFSPIDRNHHGLIDRFKNRLAAFRINKKLLELEKLDPDALKQLEYIIDGLIAGAKKSKQDQDEKEVGTE